MDDADRMLDEIVAWAAAESNARGLVLVGSRAQDRPTDALADIDAQLYVRAAEPYTRDDAWLSALRPVWVAVHDEYRHGDLTVPTRLVIFAPGVKVDFALYPAASMAQVLRTSSAHRLLLDKDHHAPEVGDAVLRPQPSEAPGEPEFVRVVGEFWFEAYHVAKYLARGELWLAKLRDWATKEFLLTMIEWHARAERGSSLDTGQAGRHMRSWAGRGVWEELHDSFGRFDADDSWDSLRATQHLFRRLATETAAALGYRYPEEIDRNISGLILTLATGQRAPGLNARPPLGNS